MGMSNRPVSHLDDHVCIALLHKHPCHDEPGQAVRLVEEFRDHLSYRLSLNLIPIYVELPRFTFIYLNLP